MRDLARSVGIALLLLWAGAAVAQTASSADAYALIERGRALAVAGDCIACHTDPASGHPFSGGRPVQTPFGVVASANITPDADTGIGGWSDAQFDAALRAGRMPNGKHLYPAMPYPYYARLSADDSRALHAYLNTLEPVHRAVRTNRLPFPFNIRALMGVWNWLYFKPGEYQPQANQSTAWNRGALLVLGPGHCGACHTPKTWLGGDRDSRALQGYTSQGWFAPDLTGDSRRGLADWSNRDIVEYLQRGHNTFAAASGPMAEVVADSSSQLPEDDLVAIATYLKQQEGPAVSATPLDAHDARMVAGAAIYQDLCAACHKADGTGVPYLIPNLAGANSVASREPTSLIHAVLRGAQSVATAAEPTAPAMPGFAGQLTDVQIAAVTTFVRNSWGHAAEPVAAAQVAAQRRQLRAAAD